MRLCGFAGTDPLVARLVRCLGTLANGFPQSRKEESAARHSRNALLVEFYELQFALRTVNITLLNFDTLDSTNTEALRQARLGADEGLCIVASQQTAGRGRHGRTWVSEKDAGLYFSIVLRPKLETRFLPLITLMTGVAVHETLAEFGATADIKWVNDVLVNDRKISGILAETAETPDGVAVVVGVGINLRSDSIAADLDGTATSIEDATGHKMGSAHVAQRLTTQLSHWYAVLNEENGPAKIIDAWRQRSSYFSGKRVRVVLENETILGVTDGLEPNGALRVRRDDESLAVIHAGDVEQLRSAA